MIVPYQYQSDCLGAIARHRATGAKKALVVMATGLGKTVTVALDTKHQLGKQPGRLLYLCHMTDILYQARSEFEAVLGKDRSFGFLHGERKDLHQVDCLFSSFQTMANWVDFFGPEEFSHIIVDESHHSKAETYLPIIKHFRPKFLLGITATPDRTDQKDIAEIYGEPIFNLPLEKALASGYLTPVDYRILTDEIQLGGVLESPGKRWNIRALNRQVFVPRRDEEIGRIIASHTDKIESPKTIVFCSSVKHCDHLTKFLPDSLPIHSRIPQRERDIRLEMFRQDMLNTVITVDCFNEGIDIPRANVIIFLRSTASRTIFLQQLGRGLRKSLGKDKVTVLDFVANLERIRAIQKMQKEVLGFLPNQGLGLDKKQTMAGEEKLPITLEVGTVKFEERQISIDRLLERVLKQEFYPTWQDAAAAVGKLGGIKTLEEYNRRYKEDPRLPSAPHREYSDFPGYEMFLTGAKTVFYETWEMASDATKQLGITTQKEYYKQYGSDPRLPSNPRQYYGDNFPGWSKFLGVDHYPTWQEASRVAVGLGLNLPEEYRKRYKEDPRLPSSPNKQYADFPGWTVFLGRKPKIFYLTWQEASEAVKRLGIKTRSEYLKRFGEDEGLNSNPERHYADFPGYEQFLGRI